MSGRSLLVTLVTLDPEATTETAGLTPIPSSTNTGDEIQQKDDTISGWWLSHPSETYESQMGLLFPIYGKVKHIPNHQPDTIWVAK